MQFTVKEKSPIKVVSEILKMDLNLFEELPKGKLGYKKQIFFNNITICYDGNEDMGTHIILSGQGCRQFEVDESLLDLIKRINIIEGKLTRIDLALDCRTGELIKFDNLLEDIIKGNIISKWKSSTEIIKRNLDGETEGRTISLGSRSSNTFLRIYDKAMEQKVDGTWYRIELEIKKENARELQKIINKDNTGQIMQGILKNYMRIVVQNNKDKNKSRWKTADYWENIINDVEKVKLARKGEEKSIEQVRNWIEKQVGASMAMVAIKDGGSIDFLTDIVSKSSKKLKAKHKKMLKE